MRVKSDLLVTIRDAAGGAGDGKADNGKAATATGTKPYPLNTCIVSGDQFGEDADMGEPIVKIYGDREVKFCCEDCIPKYEQNPEKYNTIIDDAAKAKPADAKPAGTGAQDGAKTGAAPASK